MANRAQWHGYGRYPDHYASAGFAHGKGDLYTRQTDETSKLVEYALNDESLFFNVYEPQIRANSVQYKLGVPHKRNQGNARYPGVVMGQYAGTPAAWKPYDTPGPSLDQLVDSLTRGAQSLINRVMSYNDVPGWRK